MFVSFEVGSMKVDESDSLVHIDVFRYGPMSDPITLRVTDIPLTAKRGELACTYLSIAAKTTFLSMHSLNDLRCLMCCLLIDSSELIHKLQTLYEAGS